MIAAKHAGSLAARDNNQGVLMLRKLRIVVLSLVAACAPALLASAQAQSTLRIGLAEDPDILDPTLARTFVGRIVFAAMCDKLFDIDDKLNIVPQLALGYDTSADGKTVTIKLRPGVKFQDGEPLDAAAAKFNFERNLTMKGSFRRVEISSIDTVEVADPLTIKLHLKAPFAPLIAQLTDRAGMMVSPKAAQAEGADFGNHPVCAGPFKFVERVAQGRIVLERFADYWDKGKIKIDRIVYQPIPDSTVRLANLQSGSLDLIERVGATDIPTVKKDPKLKLSTQIELGYQGLTMNIANGDRAKTPFGQDARVRQAFELSLDRDAINQVVYNGEYLVGNQWVSPNNPYYQKDLPVPKRDVAKAKKLLQEAGVKTPLPVTLMIPNNPDLRQVGEVIQAMAKEAGFDVKLQATEFASALNAAEKGDFEIFLLAWSGRTDPDGNLYSFMSCKGPLNYGKYCSAEVDDLLNKSRLTSNVGERKKIYHQIAEKVLKEGPTIYLYHRKLLVAHSDKVQGFVPYPDGLLRVVGVSLK
jgi:peptide/nickel transport system substrate-binding protein